MAFTSLRRNSDARETTIARTLHRIDTLGPPSFIPYRRRSGGRQLAAEGRNPRLDTVVAHAVGSQAARRAGLPWPELWGVWLLGLALLWAMAASDFDFRWANWLYALEGHRWALKSAFLTETLVHRGGRSLSTLAWLGVVAMWVMAWRRPAYQHLRRPLGILAISVLLGTLAVAWVKSWSDMDCPWDLLQYGGHRPFVGLFEPRPAALGHNRCFPAGHASAGYAWVALYFFFASARPGWRWLGLALGVVMGLVFGLSQQLRGAHFASHDVWAALLCWTSAVVVWRLAGRPGGVA